MAYSTTSALTFRELLAYSAGETSHWHRWLASQPAAVLDVAAGDGRLATVRGLIHHIALVERRYADRLLGDPVTTYESVPGDTLEALFGALMDGRAKLLRYLSSATDEQLAQMLEFETISAGKQSASARKVVAHALMHGIRHWAQLATLLRQAGYKTDWSHDLLMSDALE
jgi:uncharacterized damage-inducible protein DinB